jgi:hypothetical protein
MLRLSAALAILCFAAACAKPAPAFDYETATPEARTEWLAPRVAALDAGMKASFSKFGVGNELEVQPPESDAEGRTVVIAARFKDKGVKLPGKSSVIKTTILTGACPGYLESEFYTNKFTVAIELLRANGSRMISIAQTPEVCERIAEEIAEAKAEADEAKAEADEAKAEADPKKSPPAADADKPKT